jgi:prepilin-type N-terminal cleavage/methylation domain-containing protein
MRESSSSKKGLTLIEVLIALVILTVGVSSMMLAMSRCLAVVSTARKREMARSLLRRVDVEHPIDRVTIEESDESGEFDDYEGYVWLRNVIMVDEEERPGLFLVTTRVQWAQRGRDSFEEIMTYQYAPDAESVTREL